MSLAFQRAGGHTAAVNYEYQGHIALDAAAVR